MKVYVIRSDVGPVKIGVSNDPDRRARALGASAPHVVSLVHSSEHKSAFSVERLAHDLLASKRLNGEWFDVSVERAVWAIARAIEQVDELGVEANTPISVRLTDENREWLDAKASADDRSLNYLINKLVEQARASDRKARK